MNGGEEVGDVSSSGSGQGGDEPSHPKIPPGDGSQDEIFADETVWVMPPDGEDDWDPDAYHELVEADQEAGTAPWLGPDGSETDLPGSPHMGLSLGADVDLNAYQAFGGFAGISPHGFAQGGVNDGMTAGLLLNVLTEQAVTGNPALSAVPGKTFGRAAAQAAIASIAAGDRRLAGIPGVPGAAGVRMLSDDELLGTVSAAMRMQNRCEWLEYATLAEFCRRRYAESEAAIDHGVRPGRRAGEFAVEELSFQVVISSRKADERMGLAEALATRLRV